MKPVYNNVGMKVPGMYEKDGAPKGYHYMSDGTLMKDSAHKMKKGGATKDACYHKVKSRYEIWPSGYASAALGKCRKVGASNWGNKSKK